MIPNIHVTEGNNEKTKFITWKCVGGGKKNLLSGGIKSNSRKKKQRHKGRGTKQQRRNSNNNNRGTKEHNRECAKSLPPTLLWLEEAVTHRESRGKEPSRGTTTGAATHTHTVHVPPPSTPRTTLLLGGSAAINDSNSHSSLLACGRLHPDCCCCCASSSSVELGIGNRPRQPDAQRLSTLLRYQHEYYTIACC